jgi:carboxyl-terminal processing protease
MLDETPDGNLFSSLRVREADLDKHLQSGQGAEQKDEAREKAREAAREKLEAESAKKTTAAPKPLPEFGSEEDFQLAQAINRLKGKPVLVSKTMAERKVEPEAN